MTSNQIVKLGEPSTPAPFKKDRNKTKRLTCTDYNVAWICALPDLELLAARVLLDEEHATPIFDTKYDQNTYTCGLVGGHRVVLACLPSGRSGNVSASHLTMPMFNTFPNIKITLLVGIGGGVPIDLMAPKPREDIYLGDVVVGWPADGSPAVIHYDLGRWKVNDEFEQRGYVEQPDYHLVTALDKLRSDHQLGQTEFAELVGELEKLPLFSSENPSPESDKLFQATYNHTGDYYSECRECSLDELVKRPSHAEKRPGGSFNFHLGTIGSGGSVIQDGVKRDLESRRCNYARCFEMEAVGVNISSRCLVIRGIADYADSHKNDLWKYKAAGNAAVFAKELLLKMNPGVLEELTDIRSDRNPVSTLPRTLLADPDFVGRDRIIEQMKESLINSNRVSLVGLGGIGKTEIAVEFAHILRYKDSKTNIFWVYGATRSSFDEAYGKIAEELNMPGWQDPLFDPRVEVPKLLENKEYGPWVMIIDNADDYSVFFPPQDGVLDKKRKRDYLANCLPSGAQSGGKIIITTRNQKVGQDLMGTGEPIEVLELAPSDATKLLRQKIPSEKWVEEPAEMLVKELGYIPLAITQAAAFIKYYKMTSLKFYLGKLNQFHLNVKDVLSDELYDSRREGGTPNAIFQTWQISYEQIRLEDTHAAEKLSMMAVFDNQAIPDVLLREKEEFDMDEIKAIQILLDFSLIKGDSDYQFFYMHPLQQLSTQNWLRSEEHRLEKWQNNGLVLLSQRMPRSRDPGTCAKLLPHAITVLSYESNNLTCFAELSIRVCLYEKVVGRYQDYYQHATESYEALFQLYGDENLETTYAKYMVGLALERLGKCEDSTRVLGEVVRQEERMRGDDQQSFLTTALALGLAYDGVGDYETASTFAERALEGYKALSDKDGILSCRSLQARLLLREGHYEKSGSLYKKLLNDSISMYGENNSKNLDIMSAYSIAIRKYDSAESARYSRLALQGWESLRGRDHPHTTMGYCNFASILESEGNLTEAERLLRQALEARQRLLGLQHPDTLITLGQLAKILERLESFSEAENLHRQILTAREDTIGLEDVCRPVYLNALGHNLYKQGRLDEAEPILRQALEGERERIEQVGSDTTATSLSRSSSLAKDENTGEDALSRRREKLLSLDNRQILHNLALCLKGQGKYEEAEKYQTLYLEIQTRLDGAHTLRTLKCKENLAHTFRLCGKHQMALQFMQDVIEKLKQHHAENTASISKAEDRYKSMLDQVLRGDEELAFDLHKQGRNEEALPIIHEVVRRVKTSCPENETLTESCEKVYKVILGHMLLDKRELALNMQERGEVAEAVNLLRDIVESLKRWDPENTTAIREAEQRCEALARTKSRIPNPLARSVPNEQNQNRKDKASKKSSIFSFLSPRNKSASEDSSI